MYLTLCPEHFATIETPGSPARPIPDPSMTPSKPLDTPSVMSDLPSPDALLSPAPTTPATPIPITNGYPFAPSNHNRLPDADAQPMYDPPFAPNSTSNSTTVASSSSGPSNDAIAAILSNPAQLQRVLSAIHSVPMSLSMPGDVGSSSSTMRDGAQASSFLSGFRPPADGQLSPGSTLSLLNAATGMGSLSISPQRCC